MKNYEFLGHVMIGISACIVGFNIIIKNNFMPLIALITFYIGIITRIRGLDYEKNKYKKHRK